MKLNFRLKDKSLTQTYIFVDISIQGLRLKYSLGISIKTSDFNSSSQKVRGSSSEAEKTNHLLTKYKSDIIDVIRDLQYEDKLTISNLKKELDSLFRINVKFDGKYFSEFASTAIERAKTNRKARTILHYGTSLNKLLEYEKKLRHKLTFSEIDNDFYFSFVEFCKTTLNLSPNTIGGHIKNFKVWMRIATEEGFNRNMAFKNKLFKVISEEVDNVYLNEEELTLIKGLDLKGNHLDRVRDLFILGCYTGLRIGDYSKINSNNLLNGGKLLKIKTEKTGEEVIIPLNSVVREILSKYNGMPQMISQQKFNLYVKEVAKQAGILSPVTLTVTRGNIKQEEVFLKHELITSHCARRSFATNAFKAGVPSISIMKITGHKTEKNFLKYIKITKEENAKLIAIHSFFQ